MARVARVTKMRSTIDEEEEEDYFEDEQRSEEDYFEEDKIEDDDFREIATGSWSPTRIQFAINEALKLREDGNVAFRAGDYKRSTKMYSDASYDVLWLKGLTYLGAVPSNDAGLIKTTSEMLFKACSNEAASWLKYEAYVLDESGASRFQKAHNATGTALDALKEHPTVWKPGDKEMARLLYRRALACEGLGDFDAAEKEVKEACKLSPEDEIISQLRNKMKNLRNLTRLVI